MPTARTGADGAIFPAAGVNPVPSARSKVTAGTLVTLALAALSFYFADKPLARFFGAYLRAHKTLWHGTAHLPDLLAVIVWTGTPISFAAYLHFRALGDARARFWQLTGILLPVSYAYKDLLKWIFGRTEVRVWLFRHVPYGFHWFAGGKGFNSFPSGHMLVLTPLFLALWDFYPAFRLVYGFGWLMLAFLLVFTDYHFLSDVIVGAYLGWALYAAMVRWLPEAGKPAA
ncbi:MAG: phosphatase PAP2 family protein [Betaproteobacteria bacterium]|nr:phosphatase PAP2 family protein [Betaproteobacteria bacterium]